MEVTTKTAVAQPEINLEALESVTKDPAIIKLYANGFQCGATLSDASIMIRHNNQTTALLTLTFPALKSLYAQLGQIITSVNENVTEVLSFEELTAKIQQKKQ